MPGDSTDHAEGIDYQRLYEYRFRSLDRARRQAVWHEVAAQVYGWMGSPRRVLDPGAGFGEFINAVPAHERWAIDAVAHDASAMSPDVHFLLGDVRSLELPREFFDGVFVSNLLEHLPSQNEVGAVLAHLATSMAPRGIIAILGPNFRYCAKEYFDCADHTLPLTHVAVEEHLYAAGFEVERVIPRYLPFSFRGRLPVHLALVRAYLRLPLAWRLLGKQYLVIGRRP
jgi:2-polyprenyl-3-methyl-5-hydroxy-6-metoxy-1,4-benzoquinol methylase